MHPRPSRSKHNAHSDRRYDVGESPKTFCQTKEYLQAQVFLYAAEVNTVRAYRLWPRALVQDNLTDGDKKALKLYPQKERYLPKSKEDVDVDVDA